MGDGFFRYIILIASAGVVLFWSVGVPPSASFDPMTENLSRTSDYELAGKDTVISQVAGDKPSELDSEKITTTTSNVNHPPILASIGNKTVTIIKTLTFVVAASDPDGDALVYLATGLPVGAVFDATTQTFEWRPMYPRAQMGDFDVTFMVSDNGIPPKQDFEVITITVRPVKIPPIFIPAGPT